jgi:hypothetical protein
MEHIGGGYKRHEGAVYFGGTRLPKADVASFEYLGGCWARDTEHVYSAGSVLRDAKRQSFRVLSYVFGKDDSIVFFLSGSVREADAASFEALDSGCHFAAPGAHPVSYAGYGRDRTQVYHYVFTVGRPCVVRGALRESFQSLEGTFGKDARTVFVDKRAIKGARPVSWFRLQGPYSRDSDRIFYGNAVVEGADPGSFICLWGAHGTWAKDATNYYNIGRPATQEAYLNVLSAEVEHIERAKANLIAGKL